MAKERLGIGVIGCGNISLTYIPNFINHYHNVEVIAVADMFRESAERAAQKNGIKKVYSVDEILEDPDIDLIVNLTIPQAHYEINKKILLAGKHAYSEKPMAMSLEEANELVELADSKGLIVCSAPDTFLGAGLQTCRKMIDDGTLGKVTGFTANLCQHGSELWHPSPEFLYKKGAGPMLDMGPYYITALVSILGPIEELYCICSCPNPTRMIKGKPFEVEIDTSYNAVVRFKNGVVGNIFTSYDVWQSQLPHLEFYGDNGSLWGPDPNTFSGLVMYYDGLALEKHMNEDCEGFMDKLMAMHGPEKTKFLKNVPLMFPTDMSEQANMRGLGVSDIASAILHGRKPRLSGELSRHVVEALTAFKISAETHKPYIMTTTCERPEAVPAGLKLWEVE